jgi:hypothetical protein
MNPNLPLTSPKEAAGRLSDEGRVRLLSGRGEPLFFAAWERLLFIHFEVEPAALQREVPFQLDLHEGRAFVSLVAFTMRKLHLRVGHRLAGWAFKPMAIQHFLNVRTYVRHRGEPGIYFIREWLSNWLSVQLGPWLYGLPYRYAQVDYQHNHEENRFAGTVAARGDGCFRYTAEDLTRKALAPCTNGSLDEFLLERYTAYTRTHCLPRCFRIWHPPWPQTRLEISLKEDSLLQQAWPWFRTARLIGANYTPGFDGIWMGRPHLVG